MASKPNYVTTNKSDRNINIQFDQKQFNAQFEANEEKLEKQRNLESSFEMNKQDEILLSKLPHQKPFEDVIINIREMFYKVLEMLIDKQNPIPYIFSSPDRYFALAVFLIVFGALFLLLANLMKSSNEK